MHTCALCTHPQDKSCMKPCGHIAIDISFRFSTQRQASYYSIAILLGLAGPVVWEWNYSLIQWYGNGTIASSLVWEWNYSLIIGLGMEL